MAMKANYDNLLLKLKTIPVLCGRCYNYVDKVYQATCEEKPEEFDNFIHGTYYCPDCGAMVVAGLPHPDVCEKCLNEKKD